MTADEARNSPSAPTGTHDIYNFDHNIKSPHTMLLGPYRLHVRAEHLDRDILARGTTHHFSFKVDADGENRPAVAITDPHPGRWAPTAVIEEHEDLSQKSILSPEIPGRTQKDDVALILSFLTGRDVVIGNNALQPPVLRSGERLVSAIYFYAPRIDWGTLPNLVAAGAPDPIYVVCLAMSSPDLMTQFALGSAALDRLSGNWYGANGKSRYDKAFGEKFSKVALALEAALRSSGVDESLVNDIMPRLSNLASESALSKLQAFLVAHAMFPAAPDKAASERLSLLNKHRNAVLHRATVHVVKETSFEVNTQISAAVATLVLMICRVYVAKYLLKIDDGQRGIDADRATVLSFFETGMFREHNVFGESFETYLKRIEENWAKRGELP